MNKDQLREQLDRMPETYDKVMGIIEAMEKYKRTSLIIYPTYCYWVDCDGMQFSEEIHGDDRLDALYKAARWYLENEV